jgi:hypothetical protein
MFIAPVIPNLGSRWIKWSVSRPGHFNPNENPKYPLNGMLDKSQSRYGSFGSGTNLLLLPRIEPRFLRRPAHIPVTTPTAPPPISV